MESWRDAREVILIDAAASGAPVGTCHCFQAHRETIPAQLFRHSTHAFSVPEAVEMARVLGKLPPKVTVYAIEGRQFSLGAELSPQVTAAAEQLIQTIVRDIQSGAANRAEP